MMNENTETKEKRADQEEEEPPKKRPRSSSIHTKKKKGKKNVASTKCDSNASAKSIKKKKEESPTILALLRLDPILQFFTRASGKTKIPLTTIAAALPAYDDDSIVQWRELARRGVLEITDNNEKGGEPDATGGIDSSSSEIFIGFPPPPTIADGGIDNTNVQNQKLKKLNETGTLHGSTKTAAKRRLAALKRSLKLNPAPMVVVTSEDAKNGSANKKKKQTTDAPNREIQSSCSSNENSSPTFAQEGSSIPPDDGKDWDTSLVHTKENLNNFDVTEVQEDEQQARQALETFLKSGKKDTDRTKLVFEKQAAYAASQAGRQEVRGILAPDVQSKIPTLLKSSLRLDIDSISTTQKNSKHSSTGGGRRLYSHQAEAINSALRRIHTLVCTGTGSGKSLCFLVPVLATAMLSYQIPSNKEENQKIPEQNSGTSLILFPTKALAQDQMTKLQNELLEKKSDLKNRIRVGVIDGDTPHPQRAEIAKYCNIILTNPDTLHAAILPAWKGVYKKLLGRLQYVVIDEAHMYEGVFGAHVAMVLSRLSRLCSVASRTLGKNFANAELSPLPPTFLGCSATMTHPEHHFRMLCPIPKDSAITVIDQDGSPRRPKHFFAWNPPIMDLHGNSTGEVLIKRADSNKKIRSVQSNEDDDPDTGNEIGSNQAKRRRNGKELYRRHAADETALLLARAIANNVRCIAFCKTRCLVEWVFERTIAKLRSDPTTEHLTSRVESYRGGYTPEVRRSIEKKLFQGELNGVVGTSALELGVDVGGIDLTLHCGYPSSISSLLQQAGRAGRGALRLSVPSLSVMVCFNSPSEQHLWNYPRSLLDRGRSIPPSLPVNEGLLQGHMLCAGQEYPLTGSRPVTSLLEASMDSEESRSQVLNDCSLLGSTEMYNDALETLLSSKSLVKEIVSLPSTKNGKMAVYRTHNAIQKPSLRVSLRSIEPINYSIVDVTHPLQGGLMDMVHNERAVLDSIPYSRVFYHSFPGAIIMHRGQKYKVHAMAKPPAFAHYNAYRSSNLACFAKPTTARYMTRPLSTLKITIVKQIERVDIQSPSKKNLVCSDNQADIEGIQGKKSSKQTILVNCDASQTSPPPTTQDDEDVWNLTHGSFAGNGVVTVKRSVHGYKKLSPVTREEISRKEISLPPMEFDTYALWIDTEAVALSCVVSDYNDGVHALSHALLAVAPLFVPCSSSDLDCDHSYIDCTRIMLFDVRAGGAGTTAALWKHLFVPNGLLEAAIDLLENCPSCHMRTDTGYQGGCPACIQCGQCIKFNMNLSREAALIIAKRMLQRLRRSDLYKGNQPKALASLGPPGSPNRQTIISEEEAVTTPRRKARARALRHATDLRSARERQIVVGRPSWPLDQDGEGGRHEKA